ncbi:WhiB family transcriptional regulator [Kitasatospora sp. NPDC004240]
MTSTMAAGQAADSHPGSENRSEEAEIAQFLSQIDPIDVLAADGYLAGHDGNLVARALRKPQLRHALAHSVCYATDPDTNDFYRQDDEPNGAWRRRRAATIRDNCAICPVRAACTELALRDEDVHGVRGGLAEEKLERRQLTEKARLDAARDQDTQAQRAQTNRIRAAVEVQRLALQHLGSVSQQTRDRHNAAVRAAVRHRNDLIASHRADAGWTEAA